MQIDEQARIRDASRARRYRRLKLTLYGASLMSSVLENTWFAASGTSARWRQRLTAFTSRPLLADAAYLTSVQLAKSAIGLPLAYTSGYLVERAFGLTRRSPGSWFAERAKDLSLSTAINVPLTTVAFAVIARRPRDWWLVLSGVSVPLMILVTRVGPVVIAPLFNRFDPIDDAGLASRIRTLGDRAGVQIVDVYRMDMSQQTEKANAFFTGIGGAKRIVLADTLMDRFQPAEIDGVVAHELGHQVHGDIWRMVGMVASGGFGIAYVLHRVMPVIIRESRRLTGVMGTDDVAALPLYSLVLTGIGIGAQPVQAAISRRIERRTDQYALVLTGDGNAYANAMERLASQNLTEPNPPRWLVWLMYSHPPTSERVAAARAFARQHAPLTS